MDKAQLICNVIATELLPGVAAHAAPVSPATGDVPAQPSPSGPPEWVHLIPAGTFSGRDGRGPYLLDAPAVLAAFNKYGADLPIDFDHQTLDAAAKSGPVPAAGWVKAVEARADGIWARVAWTAQAAELLAAKAYRYLSPVFRFDKRTGRVTALAGAGLVHTPNLTLTAAATQGDPMPVLMERLVAMLNLPVAATPEDVTAELQKIITQLGSATADAAAAQAQLASHASSLAAEYVPLAVHQPVAEQLAALQAQALDAQALSAVDAAQAAGKLPPAMREWALAYCKADAAGFAAFCAKAPVIVGNPVANNAGKTGLDAHGLTDTDLQAARLMGIAPADFAATKTRLNLNQE